LLPHYYEHPHAVRAQKEGQTPELDTVIDASLERKIQGLA
jgi:hypothetical protein